jgi:uncharacterized protein (DUF58 family)
VIVPRTRLLVWVAIIVLPFTFVATTGTAALLISLSVIGAFIGLVLVDALGARAGLAGLGVEIPAVARMSQDREAKLQVRLRNERQKPQTVRLALGLPPEIVSLRDEAHVGLPAQSEWSWFPWVCRPARRGRYHIETAHLEVSSPLGFWDTRKRIPVRGEIRVYPNLLQDRKNLAALFLHRGVGGFHVQRQVGKGREFERLREYIPGDGFDEVHWKATARRGRPITKVFQIERTQEVYVVIDASRLSARPQERSSGASDAPLQSTRLRPPVGTAAQVAAPPTALERFITAALVLGLVAEQQGDLFGLLTFTNRIERFLKAGNGKAHYSACRDALYTLESRTVSPDFDEMCTFIRLRLRRRALLVFLTALDDPTLADSFVQNVSLISPQHLVLVNMLQPPGVGPLFTNPNVATIDELYENLGGHLRWQQLRELEKVLHRRGVRFSLLNNERLATELVSQYLGIKQRQML